MSGVYYIVHHKGRVRAFTTRLDESAIALPPSRFAATARAVLRDWNARSHYGWLGLGKLRCRRRIRFTGGHRMYVAFEQFPGDPVTEFIIHLT